MESLAESDLGFIKAIGDLDPTESSATGRDVWFTATIPDNDKAAQKLTGRLGFQEVGYSTNGASTSIIKTKPIVRALRNSKGIYEHVRAADLAPVLKPRPDPWDRYWEPKPVMADRVVLLPMTSANQTAYETVISAYQSTIFSRFLGTSHTPSKSKTDLHLIVYSDAFQDRRSYGIYKLADLVGLPSDMKPTDKQQEKCIGLVSLTGQLSLPSSSSGSGSLRRFNWEIDVTIIPSERKKGYGKESSKAAINALLEEGAGEFQEKDYDSQTKPKRPQFGVKGSQGFGEKVVMTGQFEKSNGAAKALLKALGFHTQAGIGETEKVLVSGSSKAALELMVRPVGALEGHEKTKHWVWAPESQPDHK
jgi:hypothetical protein